MIYISRAALQLNRNDEQENLQRCKTVLEVFCKQNRTSYKHFRAIVFSQTDDIDFLNPATCIRRIAPLDHVALFCTREPAYPHSLPTTIRLLIFLEHIFLFRKIKPVYMFGTESLRSDPK